MSKGCHLTSQIYNVLTYQLLVLWCYLNTIGIKCLKKPWRNHMTYEVCPKSNESDFFPQRRRARKGKRGVEAGGGETQVCSLTFLSWVRAFVAVGTLAKCTVVFVSSHGWKCRGVWSSVTWSSSARNSENLVPKRCSCWRHLMGMLFCLQPKSSGGTRRSRTEGRALRMNSVQGFLQLQELRTMWLVWRLLWIGTDVWACG